MSESSIAGSSRKRKFEAPSTIENITEDGILSLVVSSLTVKDAVRTSILSSRWRHVWKYLPNLKFDNRNLFGSDLEKYFYMLLSKSKIEEENRVLEGMAQRFINSVNSVLKHHQRTGVMAFEVRCFLHKEHSDHIDKWVDFAITSGAQEFTLNMDDGCRFWSDHALSLQLYDFPLHLFAGRRGSSIKRFFLSACVLNVPPNFDAFHSLKAIELVHVAVEDGGIEQCFLSNCHIEHLKLDYCLKLSKLRIPSTQKRLKSVVILNCLSLSSVEINAKTVTRFEYDGVSPDFSLKEPSQVTTAFIRLNDFCDTLEYFCTRLNKELPKLENLMLGFLGVLDAHTLPVNFVKATHLQSLEMGVTWGGLSCLHSILIVTPTLKKLELNLLPFGVKKSGEDGDIKRIRELPPHPHHHLKTIELKGFLAWESQIEIAKYLLNNLIVLELMSIHFYARDYLGDLKWDHFLNNTNPDSEIKMKTLAGLKGQSPHGAKVVYIP